MSKNTKSEIYPNSPLVEVIFETRFPREPVVECRWDIFFDFVRKDYSKIFVPETKVGSLTAIEPYRFEKEDGSAGILLAMNKFSYYCRKYSGFALFRKEVLNLIEMLKKSYPRMKFFSRTGFRYVNIIPFTREKGSVPLDTFLNMKLQMPAKVPERYKEINIGFIAKTNGGSITTRVETFESADQSGEAILLDIDYAKEERHSISNIKKYLDESHDYSKQLFEDLITDSYRMFLRGETI